MPNSPYFLSTGGGGVHLPHPGPVRQEPGGQHAVPDGAGLHAARLPGGTLQNLGPDGNHPPPDSHANSTGTLHAQNQTRRLTKRVSRASACLRGTESDTSVA